jgi:hypothetical protein
LAWLYVPSLHLAVAFSGAPLVVPFGAAFVLEGVFVGGGVWVVAAGAWVGAEGVFVVGAGVSSANHVATPPCFEQAPCFVLAVLYVPSLHCAVAFLGRVCASGAATK